MKNENEVKSEEMVDQNLTDLPVQVEQADQALGGQDTPHRETIEIHSWTLSSSNPTT